MDTIYSQARSTLQVKMDHLVTRTDAIFGSVERTVQALALDNDILALSLYGPDVLTERAQLRMNDALTKVGQHADVNEHLLDIIVYCTQANAVSTRDYVFTSADRFYGHFFRYQDWDLSTWRREMVDAAYYRKVYPEAVVYRYKSPLELSPHTCITYCATLYNNKGKILALIPSESLPFMSTPLLDGYDSWYSIHDLNGTLLIGADSREDGGVLSMSFLSNETGMTYTLFVDEASLRSGLHALEISIIVLLSLQVLLFIVFGVVIIWQNIQPVNALMNLVNGVSPIQLNDIEGIYTQVNHLIQRNFSLTDTLDRQVPIVENHLIQKWLNGQYEDMATLDNEFKRFSLPLPTSFHWGLMVICFHDTDALNLSTSAQKGHLYIQQHAVAHMHTIRSGLNANVVLLRYASAQQAHVFEKECAALFEGLLRMKDEVDSTIYTHATVFFDTPEHAASAFVAALEAAYRPNHQKGKGEVATLAQSVYPLWIEERILHALQQREYHVIRPILTHIEMEARSPQTLEILNEAFRLTRRRAVQEIPLKAHELLILPQEEAAMGQSPIDFMEKWCQAVCNQTAPYPAKKEAFSVDAVVAYIMDHFADKNLSLTMLSAHFDVSEAHFSRFFKKKVGQKYVSFVEVLRVKQSFPLLKQGMTIEAIADAVGYNSVYVFRSAFKRVTGATPSQFRR